MGEMAKGVPKGLLWNGPKVAPNSTSFFTYLPTTCHCVTTEKVPAKYRSLKMAEASLGKWSIFNDCGGIASTRHWISVHRGKKSAWKRFRILVQSHEALERLYEALEGPV